MRRFILAGLAIILAVPFARAALPGDSAEGQRLHEANCSGCHDAGVYTRKERRVRSLDALKQQLQNCSHVAKTDFSPAETRNLLKFLNDRYYRFE